MTSTLKCWRLKEQMSGEFVPRWRFTAQWPRSLRITSSLPPVNSTTYITCPADPKKTLGIKLPFLVMIIKNLKKYFTFEVQVQAQNQNVFFFFFTWFVEDFRKGDWWFYFTPITSRCWMTKMFGGVFERVTIRARRVWSPLSAQCLWGWTTDGTRSSSTCRTSLGGRTEPTISRRCVYRSVSASSSQKRLLFRKSDPFFFWFCFQIHANCRIRRVYFSDRLYSEDELPAEFKLYLPVQNQKAKVWTHTCQFLQN